ncbi:hypothetical protein AQZ52_11110 [Novosphingobium fuchskuhlense]|uniref:Uncharacterized protein n=1 Tax=Novosphingobium fuchskuhlense TaxID=1117702 RepID=A0A124JUG6_9SPHN|nr:hypothetical protein [Novosphingobium fuchskuhlense]KUR71212.1 hypothetical protein AQZ52_11110 [Novosphingobium fuchskuhlense]
MADTEPLLFRVSLGTLRPINGAAAEALKAVADGSMVRIEIKRTQGNVRRMAWYWVMLKIAIDNLADAFDGPVTTAMLHKWLKREAGLARPIVSRRTGEILDYDYDSIAFHNMPEGERAKFVDFASAKLAARLGCHPSELTSEAKAAA